MLLRAKLEGQGYGKGRKKKLKLDFVAKCNLPNNSFMLF